MATQRDLALLSRILDDLRSVVSARAPLADVCLDRVFDSVHQANMRKLGPDGHPTVRADGKVLKPPGWQPADILSILTEAEAGR